jgi:hypothetical protein
MQFDPAPPCSSPIVRIPAATAAEIDWRFPEAANRAAAHDGAPAPWSDTPMRIASSRRLSPALGSRPRCSNTMASVKVAPRISDVIS